MKLFFFNLDNGLTVIILPENKENDGEHTCTFQLYYGNRGNIAQSLSDLNNYSGLISYELVSKEFYYTPGNMTFSIVEISQIIAYIKNKIY
ncbi:hypothetical protein HDF18_10600 [Mucilaginibacter sp. X5P1]|uniref:hypothetical protein n=1 Tax=Mucilaginibacter sp. X5P1 TaxID=2723088 RepID=UPI0016172D75|nr:hypothetical protein [Mucilaginibacter sp. X5P1]MBB6140728.1 hypothetical protein [Mucilaginibacter sp. X5P1]